MSPTCGAALTWATRSARRSSPTRALLVSGSLNANTPPYQAEKLRWGFSYASHLVVENAGHEDTLPNEAVQAAIADSLAEKDVGHLRVRLPRPKFIPVP
jgi:hypothetical protein